jgi:hypothetical protein
MGGGGGSDARAFGNVLPLLLSLAYLDVVLR